MTVYKLRNTQSMSFSGDQRNGDSVAFSGTADSLGQTPTATFLGVNTLAELRDIGSVSAPGFGAINLMPASSLSTSGLRVDGATLFITERPGASATFSGASHIVNNSTLTAAGFDGAGNYTVNGTMNIDGTSTVNMDYVAVNGTGTFRLSGENALLRAGTVGANETVVLNGGVLSLTGGMTFLGTITDSASASSRIGRAASVDVYNTLGAVQETFDRTTGMLGLLNAQGSQLASLHFAGTGDLYAAPTTGLATNYIAITSHPSANALAVSFTH